MTYLAQVDRAVPAEPWAGRVYEHPLRLAYARPGGPAADLAWARGCMAAIGLEPSGPPVQVRTWNLYHAADPVFWLGRALDLADAHDL